MKQAYADIRALTDDAPLWFTRDGVPRYQPFHPKMLGIYDRSAGLFEIACQSCGQRLMVGDGAPTLTLHSLMRSEVVEIHVEAFVHGWTCGDPPRHDCSGGGETMHATEISVIEAWEEPAVGDWVRRIDLEGPIDLEGMVDDG